MTYTLTIPYTEIPIPANGNLPARVSYSPMVKTNIEINNQTLNFNFFSIIDSGADHGTVAKCRFSRFGKNSLDESPHPIAPIGDISQQSHHCVFPATYGERLGINIESGIHMPAHGVGGGDNWYFHAIKTWVEIEGQSWHWECMAAFSKGTDNLGIGLLGRIGFFELFEEVTFEQKNRIVRLKVLGERPPQNPPPPPSN